MEEKKEKKGFGHRCSRRNRVPARVECRLSKSSTRQQGMRIPRKRMIQTMPKLRNRTVATILRGTVVNERIDSG